MDELQRYIDVLFADYRNYAPAESLRRDMLNDLLTQREELQMKGLSSHDATRTVLATLYGYGSPAAGNRLVRGDHFRRDSALAFLLWSLTGLICSVPLLILQNYVFTGIFFLIMLFAYLRYRRCAVRLVEDDAEFMDHDEVLRKRKKAWVLWLAFAVLWCIAAYILSFTSFGKPVEVGGIYGSALTVLRFYPALLAGVFPLAASSRYHAFLENEVGAESVQTDFFTRVFESLVNRAGRKKSDKQQQGEME